MIDKIKTVPKKETENWFPDGITFQEKYEKEPELRQKVEKELADLKKKIDPAHKIQKARESGL